MAEEQKLYCPRCGKQEAVRTGQKHRCEACSFVFAVDAKQPRIGPSEVKI